MTSEGEYAKRAIVVRIQEQIDLSWNKKYATFLDLNGREPRPIDERSFTFISAFFVVSWGVSTWQGMPHMIPAIATATIVSFATLRFNEFDRAYQQYCARRAELKRLAAAEPTSALGAGAMRIFRESYRDHNKELRFADWVKAFQKFWIQNCVPSAATRKMPKPPVAESDVQPEVAAKR